MLFVLLKRFSQITTEQQFSKTENKPPSASQQDDRILPSEAESLHTTGHKKSTTGIAKKDPGIRYKCEYCSKTFTTIKDRERHTSVHTGIYKFSCVVCGKGYSRNDQLKNHHKSHLRSNWEYKFKFSLRAGKRTATVLLCFSQHSTFPVLIVNSFI